MLETEPPATLGIYANLMTRANALAILEHALQCGWKVVMGGPEPANYAEQYLAAGAHMVVSGEGELALEAILRAVPMDQIPGLFFRDAGGSTVNSGPARLLADLDAQPWPDRERVDIDRYLNVWREHHGAGSVSVITAKSSIVSVPIAVVITVWCGAPAISHAGKQIAHRSRIVFLIRFFFINNR